MRWLEKLADIIKKIKERIDEHMVNFTTLEEYI